jgi:cytochrome c
LEALKINYFIIRRFFMSKSSLVYVFFSLLIVSIILFGCKDKETEQPASHETTTPSPQPEVKPTEPTTPVEQTSTPPEQQPTTTTTEQPVTPTTQPEPTTTTPTEHPATPTEQPQQQTTTEQPVTPTTQPEPITTTPTEQPTTPVTESTEKAPEQQNQQVSKVENVAEEVEQPTDTAAPANVDGAKIFNANNCKNCHKPDVDAVGPSIITIAKTYKEKNADLAAFLKGQSEPIVTPEKAGMMKPMLLPLQTLSDNDIKALADYMLKQQ